MIAAYQRTGHGVPADDESLQVDDDGSFRMRRTNGSPVAGVFAGTVPAERLDALRAAVAGVKEPPGGAPSSPGGAGATVEYLATAEHGVALVRGATPPPGWEELAGELRRLVLDLVDQPTAAVGAELVDGGRRLVIRQLGTEAVEADPDSASISLEAVDDAGQQRGTWEAQLGDLAAGTAGGGESAGGGDDSWTRPPGWSVEIELPHDLPPGRMRGTLVIWIKAGDDSATAGLHLEAAP